MSNLQTHKAPNKMMWHDAIDYARERGEYLPSKQHAIDLGLNECWSCETASINIYHANTPEGHRSKLALNNVVTVLSTTTDQRISYRIGDIPNNQQSIEQ